MEEEDTDRESLGQPEKQLLPHGCLSNSPSSSLSWGPAWGVLVQKGLVAHLLFRN